MPKDRDALKIRSFRETSYASVSHAVDQQECREEAERGRDACHLVVAAVGLGKDLGGEGGDDGTARENLHQHQVLLRRVAK